MNSKNGDAACASDAISSSIAINLAATVKTNDDKANSRKYQHDGHISSETSTKKPDSTNSGHGITTGDGLRRQPTKYPHGLNICIQTVTGEQHTNCNTNSINDLNSSSGYSRASTLRSSWGGNNNINENHGKSDCNKDSAQDKCLRKYRINMINSPENLAELQMRRYKYPLTGNYYLDTQDATSIKLPPPLPVLRTYVQRFGRWKYLRWPIIFLASTLLFFGLITYCIWLHDVSVARERYQRRRQELSKEVQLTSTGAQLINFVANSAAVLHADESVTNAEISPTTFETIGEAISHSKQSLHESTILRAINTQTSQHPKEQNLNTFELTESSKGGFATAKKQHRNRERVKDESIETTTYASAEAALVPTNVLHFGDYNGHQNSFGVPIDENHRISQLFKNVLTPDRPFVSTTKSLAKVSPTIPPLTQLKPTHAMSSGFRTTPQDNGCYSTSLPMCQGVLDYDLTYNSTTKLQYGNEKAFQILMESNCSARALEFVCVTLEPECRPSHIGVLPPCRRICKAVLEACSIVIANWDALNELFDCSIYPDSSDPHKCEDPTRRRDYCYDKEFSCYDRSCIPHQWQCDNIKDCATGEDEDGCLVCDHQNEFRCRSNEKCVPDSVRCDLKYDCFDGSDEEDCDEYGSGEKDGAAFDEAALNSFPRIFSYASFLSPNQTHDGLYAYITAATDDENGTQILVHEITNRTSGISTEEVTNSVPGDGPKGFVNFRDSKEIMMTSDTENKFKYSSATTASRQETFNRSISSANNKVVWDSPTPLKPAASMRIAVTTEPSNISQDGGNGKVAPVKSCAPHQLRCVSGECITVNQLCDKKMDCPDGADELMCIYKEIRSSTVTAIRSSKDSTSRGRNVRMQSSTARPTVRADNRFSTRTAVRRKI